MRRLGIGYGLLAIGLWVMVGCTQQPQQVRKHNEKAEPDSALMAQIAFNMQMADAADRACREHIKAEPIAYALDDFGFWYAKTINLYADTLQKGTNVLAHIEIRELNGDLLADITEYFPIGSGDLPVAINRCMKQMGYGEEMRIVAPWYTAYGTEGTALIKPYSNLNIKLTIIE